MTPVHPVVPGHRPRRLLGPTLVVLVTAATLGSGPAVAAPADGPEDEATATPTGPVVMGLPPATASIDVAPVLEWVAPVLETVPAEFDLIRRSADVDGAVGRDQTAAREQFTLAGDVFFEFDSADLTDRARTELAAIATQLAEGSPSAVTVVGHTDSQASDSYNDRLSRERAEAVRDAIADALPGVQITVEGRGEREPLAEEKGSGDELEKARAMNRRVTIEAELSPSSEG